MQKIIISLVAVFLYTTAGLQAQQTSIQAMMDTTSITDQFAYILQKGSRYEQYKVIQENWLIQYRENLSDTISGMRKAITDQQVMLNQSDTQIQQLQTQLADAQETRNKAIREKNSLSLLGIDMDKGFYYTITWLVIVGLITLVVVLLLMNKNNSAKAQESAAELDEMKKQYDEYRNNARLSMEKVKREHLNEILKIKGRT